MLLIKKFNGNENHIQLKIDVLQKRPRVTNKNTSASAQD